MRGLAGGTIAVLLGAATGAAELLFVCCAGIALAAAAPWGRGRRAVLRAIQSLAARLVGLELRRLSFWAGITVRPEPSAANVGYLAARAVPGIAFGYLFAALAFLTVLFVSGGTVELLSGHSPIIELEFPGVRLVQDRYIVAYLYAVLTVLMLVALTAIALNVERRLARRLLGPSAQELLRRRIDELTETRAGIVAAVDEERRRIERDLHDGVQQRVVALAMLLGRARRPSTAERTAALVADAHTEAQQLLGELRDVAWRVYPTALDELGLRNALAGVAERAALPVSIDYGLRSRPAPAVQTALYFVAREAITNAAKHAGADDVTVVLTETDEEGGTEVAVQITDNGQGGAEPGGSGLSGLARRVAALDGRFDVASPPGGPTTVTAVLPCG
ncbi:signal transduction histidine kinase [Murinocardiopsis flavida]|uniref:histidine kinase n=1 Tax=Murinocardiopsis flavida TaxID=645275 RepID=A0A2P8DL72_9ACTN|nr:signal transduction histidine kinase [Murinocardiopsis flavida]